MITVNGEKLQANEVKLSALLEEKKYKTERIAVEINGDILPKSQYENTILKDGDKVEIVSFVGGG